MFTEDQTLFKNVMASSLIREEDERSRLLMDEELDKYTKALPKLEYPNVYILEVSIEYDWKFMYAGTRITHRVTSLDDFYTKEDGTTTNDVYEAYKEVSKLYFANDRRTLFDHTAEGTMHTFDNCFIYNGDILMITNIKSQIINKPNMEQVFMKLVENGVNVDGPAEIVLKHHKERNINHFEATAQKIGLAYIPDIDSFIVTDPMLFDYYSRYDNRTGTVIED